MPGTPSARGLGGPRPSRSSDFDEPVGRERWGRRTVGAAPDSDKDVLPPPTRRQFVVLAGSGSMPTKVNFWKRRFTGSRGVTSAT